MLKLNDDYEEQEDFTEIDALLDAWSHQQAETPVDLHEQIMSGLPLNTVKVKSKRKQPRYLAAAVLAAGVLLAMIGLGQLPLGADKAAVNNMSAGPQVRLADNTAEDTEKAEETQSIVQYTAGNTPKAVSVTDKQDEKNLTANENTAPEPAAEPQAANSPTLFDAADTAPADNDGAAVVSASFADRNLPVDWEQEQKDKESWLEEDRGLLAQTQDEAERQFLQQEIAWLEECLEVIRRQDAAEYEELLKNPPVRE